MSQTVEHELFQDEYESSPVPQSKRRSLLSVASVWAGFPMIITGAVTGATLVHGLGFAGGLTAMIIGNLLLLAYVGLLSALGAKTGFNFSLQASRTFGRTGYIACSALLSTLVLGWFAVQTGLVGASMEGAFGWNATIVALVAGVLFTLFTLLGIRALSIIGAISVPLFLFLGLYAAVQAGTTGADVWGYEGDSSLSIALGVGVTLVFALFADSGTMTADFTRWAKNTRHAWIATASAFPIGNLFAMVIGGVIAAATAGSGDVFGILALQGGIFPVLAVIFLVVNLGSVCTHCLYNAAVGWSTILRGRMRILTLVLGAVGVIVATLGIWGFFINWLNLLGVIVPPIGAIIIADQLLVRRAAAVSQTAIAAVRWQPFAAWAIGSGAALLVNLQAPWLSTVVTGLVVSSAAYLVLSVVTAKAEVVHPVSVAASTETDAV
ncbi:cytosine permease [Agromyces albus]|uniref:Cytosine permease n=1 Tax=Agromyces albus TaxID=205332 RepID=A0A4Q2KXD0_9MICO|nr:cytosine permease [Agromyces albus]RXZ70305.1 cytosine permease [Agromyces albus]